MAVASQVSRPLAISTTPIRCAVTWSGASHAAAAN